MELLLEDYKRRLEMVEYMVQGYKVKPKENDPNYIRLSTKASCYRSIIAELNKAIKDKL